MSIVFSAKRILCVFCETWSTNPNLNVLNSFGFSSIVSPAIRSSKYGRPKYGLLLMYNNSIYKIVKLDVSLSHIFVKVETDFDSFSLGLIYTPPDSNFSQFIDNFNITLFSVNKQFTDLPLIVGGDFNSRVRILN